MTKEEIINRIEESVWLCKKAIEEGKINTAFSYLKFLLLTAERIKNDP